MKMLHRCATCGTHSILRVPEWHVISGKRAKNHLIWHVYLRIIENARVPKWHTTLWACLTFNKLHTTCKDMINFQFQYCNHRCEVCGEKNPININRDRHSNTETGIYTNGNAAIFISRQE